MAEEIRYRLSLAAEEFNRAARRAEAEFSSFAGRVTSGSVAATQATERLTGALARVGHYTAGVLAMGGVGQMARSVSQLADEYATLQGRLRVVSDTQQQFARAMADVEGIATRQRKGLLEIGELYASAASPARLGASPGASTVADRLQTRMNTAFPPMMRKIRPQWIVPRRPKKSPSKPRQAGLFGFRAFLTLTSRAGQGAAAGEAARVLVGGPTSLHRRGARSLVGGLLVTKASGSRPGGVATASRSRCRGPTSASRRRAARA